LEIAAFSATAAASWDLERAFDISSVSFGCCLICLVSLKSHLTRAELKAFTRGVQAKNVKKSRFFIAYQT
jgi:hypothetical protein